MSAIVYEFSAAGQGAVVQAFKTTAAAATTPQTLDADVATRFGTLQAGQLFVLEYSVIDNLSGLVSSVFTDAGVVTDTP